MKIKHIVLGLSVALSPIAIGTGVVHSSSIENVERPIGEDIPVTKVYETWESKKWKTTWNEKNRVNHLYGYDEYIIYRSLKEGLNPSFVSALIINETAWGTSDALTKYNNPSGIIDPKTYQLKSYDNLYEGIDGTIELLNEIITEQEIKYVQELSRYFAPNNEMEYQLRYNKKWVDNIFEITSTLGGFDGSLTK